MAAKVKRIKITFNPIILDESVMGPFEDWEGEEMPGCSIKESLLDLLNDGDLHLNELNRFKWEEFISSIEWVDVDAPCGP